MRTTFRNIVKRGQKEKSGLNAAISFMYYVPTKPVLHGQFSYGTSHCKIKKVGPLTSQLKTQTFYFFLVFNWTSRSLAMLAVARLMKSIALGVPF